MAKKKPEHFTFFYQSKDLFFRSYLYIYSLEHAREAAKISAAVAAAGAGMCTLIL